MQKTQNYGLNKPDVEDFYNVDDMNDNMNVIDEELKKINDKTANVENKSSETIRNEITTENITHALGYVPATETELAEVNDKAEKAQSIAKGRNQAHVFSTTEAMKTWLSDAENKGKYNVGDNLYIVEVDVPDWWISEVLSEVDAETGYYYKIAQLETQKVDLTNIENDINTLQDDVNELNSDISTLNSNFTLKEVWRGDIVGGTAISSGQTLTFPTSLNNYSNWNYMVLSLHNSSHNIRYQLFIHKSLVGITANYKSLIPYDMSDERVNSISFVLSTLNTSITPTISTTGWYLISVHLL